MCPLRCPDRTAIRPGGGSARRDAGARDRGERASERGARGTKREISLSLSLSPSSTVVSARGGGASPSSRERPDHRSAIVSSPRARARARRGRRGRRGRRDARRESSAERDERRCLRRPQRRRRRTGRAKTRAVTWGVRRRGGRQRARVAVGVSKSRGERRAREGAEGEGGVDDRGRRDEWIGIIFIHRSSASRGRRRARTSAKWASIELGKRTPATAELAFGRARRAPRAGSATGATRVGGRYRRDDARAR